MDIKPAKPLDPDPRAAQFYVDALRALDHAGAPYAVGGGFAMAHYTGIARNTKDLDIFVRPQDRDRTLSTLTAAGYRTEFFYPFWIAKAIHGEAFIDVLYSSGNGLCVVDDDWFRFSVPLDVLGHPTRIVPAEEQLWSKAFVQDRDRFDGADIIHLVLAQGHRMDWQRLLRRFTGHEGVLFSHLILFGYAFPTERRRSVPDWVLDRLWTTVRDAPPPPDRICRGTFLAQRSYGTALKHWGFLDARLKPRGPLDIDELTQLPAPGD